MIRSRGLRADGAAAERTMRVLEIRLLPATTSWAVSVAVEPAVNELTPPSVSFGAQRSTVILKWQTNHCLTL